MDWRIAIVAILGFAGAFVHGAVGFGTAMIIMMALPFFFDTAAATSICNAMSTASTIVLFLGFRKYVNYRRIAFPAVLFAIFSIAGVCMAKFLKLSVLTLIFGLFFIAIAVFCMCFSERIRIRTTRVNETLVCGFSGIMSGLIGIGGPLTALYYVNAADSINEYKADLQLLFTVSTVVTLVSRSVAGMLPVNMLPYVIVGTATTLIGQYLGKRIGSGMSVKLTRLLVYSLVGVSGLVTVIKVLFLK